ncbi:MAG: LysM peptidoglycan-binding domain-containing protein [Shewanella sp.]|nr:LysM peptidoglycan-binding domain-containing protein [Shewanella sp.]
MRVTHYLIASSIIMLAGCQTTTNVPQQSIPAVVPTKLIIEPEPSVTADIEESITSIDVWERIRLGMKLPVTDRKLVNQYRNYYLKHPKHLMRVSKRALPFMYMIVEEIEKRDLPLELALLPIVESSFDPFAYSHGAASGLWQFTSPMARHFGLKMNWWYDGRRDVYSATIAALDMLEYLYKKTHKNWSYAIAAYNTGEGRVLRAVRNNKRHGKSTDFWALDLPTETERYVPQLIALADVIKNSEKYGIDLFPIPNEPQVKVVKVDSQIDLALAAEFAGISTEALYKLNPGFNRWATGPNGPHHLVLPIENADDFELALAETDPKKRLKWERYKIKSGDSMGVIAKRFHTTSSVIKSVNNIDGNIIIAGEHLLIPVSAKDASHYTLTANARLKHKQGISRGNTKLNYTVSSGDSLWEIARNHKVKTSDLARWNNMAPKDRLRVGKELVIWKNKSSTKSNSVIRTVNYKVRSGDSLARIADKFNVTVKELRKWNKLDESKYIQPGQTLSLYVDVKKYSS